MVLLLCAGSIILRTQRPLLPHASVRLKSFTAAIERGRRGGFDRPSGSRTRTRTADGSEHSRTGLTGRRELRFERSAYARDGQTHSARERPSPVSRRRFTGTREFGDREETLSKQAERRVVNHTTDLSRSKLDARDEGARDPRRRATQHTESHRRSKLVKENSLPKSGNLRRTKETQESKPKLLQLETLPYTTAASEFLYGYSSALAALKANRRQLYKIYVHSRALDRVGLMEFIRTKKLFSITQEVDDNYLRAMDKASNGRPHNGVILECSPLPKPPILGLGPVSTDAETFTALIGPQSAEDARVNGTQELYSYNSEGWRFPLVLYVDGVVSLYVFVVQPPTANEKYKLNEGNLGAMARSAYLLGVDAIVTAIRETAPWSQVAIKASAGAAEAIPVFTVDQPRRFLDQCTRAGWRIYASGAVPPEEESRTERRDVSDDADGKILYSIGKTRNRLPAGYSPLAQHPTLLMMGSEDSGLRDGLVNRAHYQASIPHRRKVDEIGVDSFNVSVATSLLCYEMLKRPKSAASMAGTKDLLF